MKRLIFLFSLLICMQVKAVDFPLCYESPGGTGTRATVVQTPGFQGRYWYCPKESLDGMKYGAYVWKDGYSFKWGSLPASSSMAALLAEAWAVNVSADCAKARLDPADEFYAICNAVDSAAHLDPDKPKLLGWHVTPYGLYASRMLFYAVTDDTGKTDWYQLPKRAAVGSVCKCGILKLRKDNDSMCPAAWDDAAQSFGGLAPCTQDKP